MWKLNKEEEEAEYEEEGKVNMNQSGRDTKRRTKGRERRGGREGRGEVKILKRGAPPCLPFSLAPSFHVSLPHFMIVNFYSDAERTGTSTKTKSVGE